MRSATCDYCTHDFDGSLPQCPHCARPSRFPNVEAVRQPEERQAFAERYRKALEDANSAGIMPLAQKFEALAAMAQASIGRSDVEATRIASSDDQAYGTFYQLLDAGIRLPSGTKWDRLRGLADFELFGHNRDEIRFAALGTDDRWLTHYGPVCLVLAENMISHRTTVFLENSAVYFEKQRASGKEPPEIAGSRVLWPERGQLALTKHVSELAEASDSDNLGKMLLSAGAAAELDVFLEAHVYGSLTRRSLAKVVVDSRSTSRALVEDLGRWLSEIGVPVVVT